MPELHPIAKALAAEQDRQQLNGSQMAAKLEVTEAAWSLVRRGLKQPGRKVITGAIRGFRRINVTKLLREAKEEN